MYEETGLSIDEDSAELLCLWESNYPIDVASGPVRSQHLVVYVIASMDFTSSEIKLQETEVQRAEWVKCADLDSIIGSAGAPTDAVTEGTDVTAAACETRPTCANTAQGTRFALDIWRRFCG